MEINLIGFFESDCHAATISNLRINQQMEETTKKAAFELLRDPLSSVTRATRKTLFVLSSICILVAYTGVVPDEASILGFKFSGLTQNAINSDCPVCR